MKQFFKPWHNDKAAEVGLDEKVVYLYNEDESEYQMNIIHAFSLAKKKSSGSNEDNNVLLVDEKGSF